MLNAALESEAHGGATNNTIATAQGLEASSFALQGTSNRLAVLGEGTPGENDLYSFGLGAGESAGLTLTSFNGAGIDLELRDSSDAVLARGIVGVANVDEYISGFVAPSAGTFYARLSGAATDTEYSLVVTRGSTFDLEPNNASADARDISVSSQVLGYLSPTLAEDFESGSLSGAWSTYLTTYGRNRVTGIHGTAAGSFALLLDSRQNFRYGLNEATWTVNLAGISAPTLSFYQAEWGSEVTNAMPLDFTGHYNADGVAISDDGTNWRRVLNATTQSSGVWQQYTVDLVTEAAAAGISLDGLLYIKFQQYDNYPIAIKGRGWDEIVIKIGDPEDQFLFPVESGDTLTLTTSTPGDGPGEPESNLDPILELYDPTGTLVASNNNSAPDGKNALINHTASSSGAYRVRVAPVTGKGPYTLRVIGATGTPTPFQVVSSSVVTGTVLALFPGTLQVQFSEGMLLTSVEASDLTIDSGPATGVTVVDGRTLEFDIASLEAGDGVYNVSIAAGALEDLQGNPNDPFAMIFTLDTTGPVVTSSSILQNDVIAPGDLAYTVGFIEDLSTAGLGAEDISLLEAFSGNAIPVAGFDYDAATDTLTVDFLGLEDGAYTLTLQSGVDAFRDPVDNLLNGAPSFPLPSGQGDPAADPFVVTFAVDSITSTFPFLLRAKSPRGSLIYDVDAESAFHAVGDTNGFTLDLAAGQRVTVVFTPVATSTQGHVELFGPGGGSLGAAAASGVGEVALLQTAPAAAAGTYRIDVTSLAGTGLYKLQVILNAAAEEEELLGASNDTIGTAQHIDGSVALQGAADQVAVVGTGNSDPPDMYSFTLGAGQSATVVVASQDGGQVDMDVELLDAGGAQQALGMKDAKNVDA